MATNQCRGCGQWAGRGHHCVPRANVHNFVPAAAKFEGLRQAKREFGSAPKPSILTRVRHAAQWSWSERSLKKEANARIARAQETLGNETA